MEKRMSPACCHPLSEGGIASILLLFAMSAFSVLGVAALTTGLGSAPAGRTYTIFRSIPEDALTKFVADMVVPNDWRTQGASGSYQFQLPVLVPETGAEDNGSIAAWHAMTEVPGMAICCESRAGVCARRNESSGGRIVDWNPGADDAQWTSFDLASRQDASAPHPDSGDVVIATVSSPAAAPIDASAMSCQLEFEGAVIAKGLAHLRQVPREDGSGLTAEVVAGTMSVAVRTK